MLEAIFASSISFVVITIATYLLKINAKVAKASRLEEINSAITPFKETIKGFGNHSRQVGNPTQMLF